MERALQKRHSRRRVEDVNGRAHYEVVFTPEQGPKRINYYDKETFLVLKSVSERKNQRGADKTEIFLEDYIKTGEILSAHKMTRCVNGRVPDITVVKSIETNIEMPEGIFDLPEEIQEIIQKKMKARRCMNPFRQFLLTPGYGSLLLSE